MIGAATQNDTKYSLRGLCADLEAQIELTANHDPEITGLTADSRQVKPGYLFAAVRGRQVDGHDYVEQAIAAGATAVLVEAADAAAPGAAVVRVRDSREALARLAARWQGLNDALEAGLLKLSGVTGTNGKSTICFLVRAMMNHAGQPCACIGTIEYDLVGRRADASLTTPDAVELAKLLAEARRHGANRVVMEVSSHALDQRRTDGLRFATAVFTNLTGDHHDYHGGAEQYLVAKKRLFDGLDESAIALVNADDAVAERVIADCRARIVRYGLGPGTELRGAIEEMSSAGTRLSVHHDGGAIEVRTPLVGGHNAYNVLAAFGLGLAEGLAAETVAEGLASLKTVPGRLERVGGADYPLDVFVDYAHTDDALRNVLRAARQICRGRLTVVFGCGGDRDRSKRPRMARVAAESADRIIVTSDNPRTEDPQRIIDDITAGFDSGQRNRVTVEPDRESAMARAIREAQEGDLVLIAGKGHEDYQIVGSARHWFDDRVVAARHLAQKYGASP